jgi:hypothetical protein
MKTPLVYLCSIGEYSQIVSATRSRLPPNAVLYKTLIDACIACIHAATRRAVPPQIRHYRENQVVAGILHEYVLLEMP